MRAVAGSAPRSPVLTGSPAPAWLPAHEMLSDFPQSSQGSLAQQSGGSSKRKVRRRAPRWIRSACWSLIWLSLALGLPTTPSMHLCTQASGDEILGPFTRTVNLPAGGGRAVGFRTSIRAPRSLSVGYVPVEITLSAQAPLPADRRLVYRFTTIEGGQTPPQNGMQIDVPILAPQGTRNAKWVRYLPKWSAGFALEVTVYEDGRAILDYNDVLGDGLQPGRQKLRSQLDIEYGANWVFVSPDETVVENKVPNLRGLWQDAYRGRAPGSSAFWSQMLSGPTVLGVGQSELPTDWRGYQNYDAVVLSTLSAERLVEKEDEWHALRGWILNGGALVIYDAESPEEASRLLGFAWSDDEEASNRIVRGAENYEKSLSTRRYQAQRYISELQADSTNTGSPQPNATAGGMTALLPNKQTQIDFERELKRWQERRESLENEPSFSTAEWLKRVHVQSVGSGEVYFLSRTAEGQVPPDAYWSIIKYSLDFRVSPTVRRGVDPMVGDRKFSSWLIPGVAQPPVYTFMGLLTAFVILVGPIAYRRTAKQGRSYLMFAIAPVLALFTTVAMFGYGIVSDGFGTVVRVRQLTWVDGASKAAGERVRSTYFAGVRPGNGLTFAGDAEVIGYREGTGQAWEELDELSYAMMGRITVREDEQQFDSSFLPSRQQKQFITHQPRQDLGRIRLIPDPKGILAPELKNEFPFVLRSLVVRDPKGAYWFCEEVDTGESKRCTALTIQDASKSLGKLYRDHQPVSAVRQTTSRVNQYRNLIFDVVTEINRNIVAKTNMSDGVFEHWLQSHLQTAGEIPTSHFVGVSDVTEDVLAVESCEVSSSVRYVFGTLP